MLRFTAQTLLLFYLVVDRINIPVDPASGKSARCSENFAEDKSVFRNYLVEKRFVHENELPVISCRSGHGSEFERDGGRQS
jgi:hypothetical protein